MRRRRSASVLLAAGAMTSCSLAFGIQGGDYVGAADAGRSREDGSGSASDRPPDGADTDGGPPAEAGPCDLCDDFERDVVARDGWTIEIDGANLAIDKTHFDKTPHRSLHASVAAGSGGTRFAFLSSPFTAAHHAHCSFSLLLNDPGDASDTVDLFLVEATGNGVPQPSSIRFGLAQNAFQVRQDIQMGDGGCECPSRNFVFGNPATPAPPKSPWRTVTLDTTLESVTVTVDDEMHTYDFDALAFTQLRVRLGILDFAATAADVDIDDLVCESD